MSTDLFGKPAEESTSTALEQLVGEGKKFATIEDLAKGKLTSDEHITKLESEAAANVKEPEQPNVAELIKAVKDAAANTKEGETEETKPMSTEDLQELIKSVLDGENAASTKDANRAKGNALVLAKANGDVDVAKSMIAERATAVGMTPTSLAELSENSPEAFAKLMEIDSKTQAPNTATLPNAANALPGGPVLEVDGHKTSSYFEAKRKEMGNLKYIHDKALQAEIGRASQALGARFNQ